MRQKILLTGEESGERRIIAATDQGYAKAKENRDGKGFPI
jgi:hypothetical protein